MLEEMAENRLNQYLTFGLGDEIFALNVFQVREILDIAAVTKIPSTPDFMLGVINVRGCVVPVIDLKAKLNLKRTNQTINNRFVIIEIIIESNMTIIGLLADAVHNVMDLSAEKIEAPPQLGVRWKSNFIKGIGKHNEDFIMILDVDHLFSAEEIAMLKNER